jgi:hypothetical protein
MTMTPRTHGCCRACGDVRAVGELRPVVGPADLDTILTSAFLCADEFADECRTRARGRVKKMFVAIEPAESWAGGHLHLVTDDPRRAEEHAAAVHGVTAQWFIHSDYRIHRKEPK